MYLETWAATWNLYRSSTLFSSSNPSTCFLTLGSEWLLTRANSWPIIACKIWWNLAIFQESIKNFTTWASNFLKGMANPFLSSCLPKLPSAWGGFKTQNQAFSVCCIHPFARRPSAPLLNYHCVLMGRSISRTILTLKTDQGLELLQ